MVSLYSFLVGRWNRSLSLFLLQTSIRLHRSAIKRAEVLNMAFIRRVMIQSELFGIPFLEALRVWYFPLLLCETKDHDLILQDVLHNPQVCY